MPNDRASPAQQYTDSEHEDSILLSWLNTVHRFIFHEFIKSFFKEKPFKAHLELLNSKR